MCHYCIQCAMCPLFITSMASIACSCSLQQRLSSCEMAWVTADKQERTATLEWRDLDSSIRETADVKQRKSSWRLIAADNAVLDCTKGKRRSRSAPNYGKRKNIKYLSWIGKGWILGSMLVWDFTQGRIVIQYRSFGTTYRFHLQDPRSPRRHRLVRRSRTQSCTSTTETSSRPAAF